MSEKVCLLNKWSYAKKRDVQLSHLHPADGFLCLKEEDPWSWIQNNQAETQSVRHLELQIREVEEISDSIGELSNLSHLSITYGGSLKCVPNTILSMHNLQYLYLHGCKNLQELPHNLGDLKSLTHLCLSFCDTITSLPTSVAKLPKLITLKVEYCKYLRELPAVSSVVELTLLGCCITTGCYYRGHCLPFCNCVEARFANLNDFVSLRHLAYGCGFWNMHHQLPENMDKLKHLLILDIHHSNIKWLPHNIAMLSKLRFLFLPQIFRVETLPFHLNDSLIISVKYTHVRKSWKELKTEMLELFSSPMVGVDPSEYLPLKGDPEPWIRNNYHLHSLVRILDLELFHLYDDTCAGYLSHLPHTFTRVTHISLYGYEIGVCVDSLFDSLQRLSTLESLQLDFESFPTDMMNLPDSLKRLTLLMHPQESEQLNSLPECLTKLSNLKTLELFQFNLVSLPTNMNLFKLKLMDSTIKLPPIGLQHLEIIHSTNYCYDEFICCEKLQILLDNQLNSMKTLSVTCWEIKCFPKIGLHNLQELQLKDCFNLIALPPNIDELVNLCTINLSGTRISYLPDSIRKLPNVQHLILPKCFRIESMSSDFKKVFNMFSIDDTYDKYYDNICNYHKKGSSTENSNKHIDSTLRNNEVVLRESEKDIIGEQQRSSHQPLNLPDAAPAVRGETGSPFNGRNNIVGENSNQTNCSSQNQTMEILSLGIPSEAIHDENKKSPQSKGYRQRVEITREDIERVTAKNMTLVDAGRELGVSRSTMKRRCREVGINEWPLNTKASLKRHCANKRKQHSKSSSGSSSYYTVKSTYKDDTVRFNCSTSTCLVDLKKDLAKNLEIKFGTFKVKYQDEEKDWVLMTTDDHLNDALSLMKSDEDNVLRLLVIEL